MPDVREVFEMATKTVRPDPGVEERQHRKQRSHAIRQKVGAYAVVAAVLIGATVLGIVTLGGEERTKPAAEGQLTRENLAGVWRTRGEASNLPVLVFRPDGQFEIHRPLEHRLEGTYQVDGNTITLTDPHQCRGMQWTARLPEDGVLEFTLTDIGLRVGPLASPESCAAPLGSNVEESQRFAFERVSPRSPATFDLRTGGSAEDGRPPSVLGDLSGFWLIDGGDKVLRIDLFADNAANYRMWVGGALAPDDAGSVSLEDGSLVFRSNTLSPSLGSPTCPEGVDQTVWENVLVSLAGHAFSADVPRGACGGLAAGRVSWLRISGQGDYR